MSGSAAERAGGGGRGAKTAAGTVAPPAVGAALPGGAHVAVLASAGTGKTYRLTSRYVALIAAGAAPESILASTFTRKAAGEILGRVMGRLAGLARNEKERAAFGAETGREIDAGEAQRLAAGFARAMHRVSILTLDAMFVRMLGGFGLDLGLPPRWTILEDEADVALREAAIDRAVASADREEIAAILEMLASGGPSREVRGLLERSVQAAHGHWVWATDPAVWSVIGPEGAALTDVACERLREELRSAEVPGAPEKPNGHWVRALESVCRAFDEADWDKVAGSGLVAKALTGEQYQRKDYPPALREAIERLAGHVRNVLLEQLARKNASTASFLAQFDREYRRLKEAEAAFRFDDVPAILGGVKLDEHLADLYFRLDARFEHALLDEFQDTSLLQFRLVQPLLAEIMAHGDGSRSLLVVGDEKQSLYGWRGAEPGLLSSLKAHWPQLNEESLTMNRRSSPVIIDAVNAVFEGLKERLGASGEGGAGGAGGFEDLPATRAWVERFPEQVAHRRGPGYAALWVMPEEKEEHAAFAAARVAEIVKRKPDASVGVLVRRNARIPRLKFELARLKIDASEEGGNPVTDAPAVAAAVSALTLALHPEASAAYFHLATGPLAGDLECGDPVSGAARARVASALRRRLFGDGLVVFFEGLQRAAAGAMDARDAFRFEQLLWLARAHESAAPDDMAGFLAIVRGRGVDDPSRRPVRIMTVHKSKGLEFDAVVMADLDGGWSPKAGAVLVDRSDDAGNVSPLNPVRAVTTAPGSALIALDPRLKRLHDQLRDRIAVEELCNLYVAMTRARSHLEMLVEPRKGEADLSSPSAAKVLVLALTGSGARPPEASAADRPLWASADAPAWDWEVEKKAGEGDGSEATDEPVRELRPRLAEGEPPRHRWMRTSPSALEGESVVNAGDMFGRGASTARSIGTATHKLLEGVEWWGEDGAAPMWPDADELARDLGCEVCDVEESVARLGRGAAASLLHRALARARYAAWGEGLELRVLRETRFVVSDRIEGRSVVLSGMFDRLVTASRGGRVVRAEVLDFKTDEVEGEAIAERAAMYRPQIAAYRRAVAKWLRLDESEVGTTLLFLHPGVEVDPLA